MIFRVASRTLAAASAVLVLLTIGCRDATAPGRDTGLATGTYGLVAVSGRGPTAGRFTLTRDGQATRRVQYGSPDDPGLEYVATGSFALVRPNTIAFALHEGGGPAGHVWHVRGVWRGEEFSIRHPDPADGPDVIETYRRLAE
jgi:hypothetical protein